MDEFTFVEQDTSNNPNKEGKNELLNGKFKYIICIIAYLFAMSILAAIIQVIAIFIIVKVYPELAFYIDESGEIIEDVYNVLVLKVSFWTNIIISILLFITTVTLLFKDLKKDFKSFFNNKIIINLLIMIVAYIIMTYGNLIANVIIEAVVGKGTSANQASIESIMQGNYIIPMIFMIVVFAPVYEELIFRKCIFGLFKKPWIGFVVSSLAFAAIHVSSGGDFIYILAYLVPALVFGGVYWISNKNIYLSLGMHVLNNFISVIIILLTPVIQNI